jgi:hypothetical protein
LVIGLLLGRISLADELRPEGTFSNGSGANLPLATLRFAESGWKKGRDQGFALALQRGTDYFYLWTQRVAGAGLGARPVCEGHLVDAHHNTIEVDGLRSFGIADLEGNGSTYLVALTRDGAGLLAWPMDGCAGGSIVASVASVQRIDTGEARSGYQRLVTGDFSDTGIDGIELISTDAAQISQWRFANNRFEMLRSDPMLVTAGSGKRVKKVLYVTTTTRLSGAKANAAEATATALLHDEGFTLYRNGAPIHYAPNCREAPANCANRILLVNLDQGFSDGLQDLARKDASRAGEVLKRMVDALHDARRTFRVWALIDPIQQNRAATLRILDELARAGIPFILDFYSSDVTNLTSVKKDWLDYSPRASEPVKGVSLSLEGSATDPDNLSFYVERYGANFAGVRFMERLGMDIQAGDPSFPQILGDQIVAQRELSFDWGLARRLLSWANRNQRYVVWADQALYLPYECYWTADEVGRAAARRDLYIKAERELARQNPYLVPMYDNNEGLKRCGVAKNEFQMTPRNFRLQSWQLIPEWLAAVKGGATPLTGRQGFGISVQSWTTDSDPLLSAATLPPEEMAIWILDALQKGATIVELEPYFYLFAWPQEGILHESRPAPDGQAMGDARDTLTQILHDVTGS